MTTFADDVKMVLAEVAPQLAARINEPTQGDDWNGQSPFSIAGPLLSRSAHDTMHRAARLVADRRGLPRTRCIDCRWAVYVAQDPGVAPAPCPHIEETT